MYRFLTSAICFLLITFLTNAARNTNTNSNSNNPPTESCDQLDSPQTCLIDNRHIDESSWQIEKNRKVTSLKLTNIQSENLPINVDESFPNLVSYSASETSFRILKKEHLRHLRSLESLSLNKGELIRVRRDAFDDMPNLQRLDLGYNFIKMVSPENFRELGKLEFLSIKNNEIEEISPRIFKGLLNLKEFNGDDNKLASITGETFSNNRRLRNISLKGNNLKFVDDSTFNGLKELQSLDLSGNDCIDKVYNFRGTAGALLTAIRMDMNNFCQIGVKD
ncbi:unnamed protein product [Chironomus riparius]|uniref:Uncharacterized protein n=1 Tax=Chironomus riparius TaxID=315576 RepID=A0A9N9SBR0_9DIPT|nr:unnamed protein product [Chironomus riparius]